MPTTSKRSRRAAALTAAVVALATAGGIAAASPAAADSRLLIGLGDSYSTGAGIPPEDQNLRDCPRSTQAYPMVAAAELGFTGQNHACGGAVLDDFTNTSRRGAPPQTADIGGADILTWTMGGNDVGGPRGVLESSSSAASMASFAAAAAALRPELVAAYTDVQRAAPGAQMFILGYPDIVPDSQQALEACLGATAQGLVAADIHHNVELLNAAIAAAAATVGATFVDTSASFDGHEMCTPEAYANAPDERSPESPGGSLHPNQAGHLMMAADLIAAIGGPDQPPPPAPAPPAPGPPVPAPPAPGPPAVGPPSIPGLSPEERAAARAVAVALLERIRDAGDRPGLDLSSLRDRFGAGGR